MALLEREAIRFAESLADYEQVSAVEIGGNDDRGHWSSFRDHRFELDYEMGSHADYGDFIGALVDYKQFLGLRLRKEVA